MKNIIALVALGACAGAALAQQTDVIRNGHFEDVDRDGNLGDEWGLWSNTGFYAFWVGIPHATIWADLIDNSGGYFQTGIEGVAGATYTFRINNMRIEENFNANLRFGLEFYAADDGTKIDETFEIIDSNQALDDVPTGDGLSFEMSAVAPEGTAFVRPVIAFDGAFPVEAEQLNAFIFSVSLLTDAEPSVEPTCPADFDGNGVANVNDLLGFLGAFRGGCPDE